MDKDGKQREGERRRDLRWEKRGEGGERRREEGRRTKMGECEGGREREG